jgi:hypothetical protein
MVLYDVFCIAYFCYRVMTGIYKEQNFIEN